MTAAADPVAELQTATFVQFLDLVEFQAGLSPEREYSCLRAISMSAASRSAAEPNQ